MDIEELQIKECGETLSDKKQIYIVDDDQSVCHALKELLATYGFTVRTFSSSDEFSGAVSKSTGCNTREG